MKRALADGITSPQIDDWYERARRAGALGGKLLGAGGGGFLLVYAHEDRHEAILRALPELTLVDFRFEPQGSKIIYVEETPGNSTPSLGMSAVRILPGDARPAGGGSSHD
jgi:D-glycero-alpha-D-manno-heptose-7-phosphate kinase